MEYYRVAGHETLTQALKSAINQSQGNQPWIIAGINGHRYFLFRSRANLGQLLYKTATHKVSLNMEIEGVAADEQDHNVRRGRAKALDEVVSQSLLTGVDRDSGSAHAEEFLIANWYRCVKEFRATCSSAMKNVELFASHSPCTTGDQNPSLRRMIAGVDYPSSCTCKLARFADRNRDQRWKLWWREPFGVSGVNDVPDTIGRMQVARMPGDLQMLCNTVRREPKAPRNPSDSSLLSSPISTPPSSPSVNSRPKGYKSAHQLLQNEDDEGEKPALQLLRNNRQL